MFYEKPKKRFGQNFLKDFSIIDKIIEIVNPTLQDTFIEIGPGQGALTKAILPKVHQLIAIEIDKQLIEPLKLSCAELGNLLIINQDILKVDLLKLSKQTIRLIGNIPYNISTPLIFHCLQYKSIIQECHFMVQREVADRLSSLPNSSTYGRLSISIQYHANVKKLFDVDSDAFYPKPKVTSSFVRIKFFQSPPIPAYNEEHFNQLVRAAFNHRRKIIYNSLRGYVDKYTFEKCNIDPKLRPENLTLENFVSLSNQCQIK